MITAGKRPARAMGGLAGKRPARAMGGGSREAEKCNGIQIR